MNKHVTFLSLIACVVMLSACAYAPLKKEEQKQEYPFIRLAPSAPPQTKFEQKPEPTMPLRQIWRPGHWSYNGQSFDWVRGTYMLRPDPTASWIQDRWEKHLYGWAFIPGHWQ